MKKYLTLLVAVIACIAGSAEIRAESSYTLTITRGSIEGTYTFSGSINQSGKCWWKRSKRIPAGTYHAAATTMSSKDKPGLFLYEFAPTPDSTNSRPYQGSMNDLFVGIFVHAGKNQYYSDGCIVIDDPEFKEIYDDISPRDTPNVTIVVQDE